MRAMWMTVAFVATALAGCVDAPVAPDSGPEPGTDAEPTADRKAARDAFLAGRPEFCPNEETCDFWDQQYHMPRVFDPDTTEFDIVILPPAGGASLDWIATTRYAATTWIDGIQAFAAPWLRDNLTIRVYAVGVDVPTLDAVADPEALVVSNAGYGPFGFASTPIDVLCEILGVGLVEDHGGHDHGTHGVRAASCETIGYTCLAYNSGGLTTLGMHRVTAHEIGHCLGLGHAGDASEFKARYVPIEDIMSYQENATHAHCPSNLDVRVLEGVYAPFLGRPKALWMARDAYVTMDPLDYATTACENTPGA